MCDYQESVATRQTHGQTDAGQSDPYVPLYIGCDTKIELQSSNTSELIIFHIFFYILVDKYNPKEADVRYMLPFFDQLFPFLPKNLRKILYLGVNFEQVSVFYDDLILSKDF